MKQLAFLALSTLITGTAWAQCSGLPRPHGDLQWSEPEQLISPDRSWILEVHPILENDGNHSPVTIRRCGGSKSWPLFILNRDAEAYWSSDSNHILVVNEPLSGSNELLFFSLLALTAGDQKSPPDALDKRVRDLLVRQLGKTKHIEFYLPTLISWKNNNVLLAVGGVTFTSNNGPTEPYCYGFQVDTEDLRISSVLPENELQSSTGQDCRFFP